MTSNNRSTHVHTVVHTAHDAHVSQCDIFGVSRSPVFIVKENEFLIRSLLLVLVVQLYITLVCEGGLE